MLLAIAGGQQPQLAFPKDISCDLPTEREINVCMNDQRKKWEDSLNAEYKAALKRVSSDQRYLLVDSERFWVQYRDANCAVAFAHLGTVATYLGEQCLLNMTRDRAKELHGLHDEDDD
jgi:uncharacterized protein YecT (DUF1311 family)